MEHPVPANELPPQVAKICGPQAPRQLKEMAAAGRVPLGPVDLVTALYALAHDGDGGIAERARASLDGVPDGVLNGALSQPLDPRILDGLAGLVTKRPDAIERILLNRSVADDTVGRLAGKLRSENLLEIIAANEERLLRFPRIIEALYFNKAARMSTVDRCVELAVRNDIELEGIPTFREIKAALEGQLIVEASEEPTPDDLNFMSAMESAEGDDLNFDEVEDFMDIGESGDEDTEEEVRNVQASLARMSVSEKIRAATLGSATQRSVLVRDSNKLVCMAVLKSPAVGDSEILRYSKAKSLPEEAVRYIASNREWTKHYQVKLNLVGNPRTPIHDALRFIQFLRPNDVRQLERSKDVPQAINVAARNLREKRGGK